MDTTALPLFPDPNGDAAPAPPATPPAPEPAAAPIAPRTRANRPKPAAKAEQSTPQPDAEVVIIGAGLAGLNCARELSLAGRSCLILEAADAPGGRVRTDIVDGFRLDRGFQVLLTEYPEARRVLDYDKLSLRSFLPGALVRQGGSFHRFADPFRELRKGLAFATDPVVSLGDKLRVAKLRRACLAADELSLFSSPEETTREFLRRAGFSSAMVERFFEPFFGGVFLERNLVTSARFFQYLFRLFSLGAAAVPELGMEEIPRQLAASLPADSLRLNSGVRSLAKVDLGWKIETTSGTTLTAGQLVMAAREPEAKALLAGVRTPGPAPARNWNRTTTFYYATATPPVDEPVIVLNGEGRSAGPINHLAVMSLVSPAYAPPGAHLVCVNVVGSAPENDSGMEALEAEVRNQLRRWFGPSASSWQVVGGYPIAHALPLQLSMAPQRQTQSDTGILLCGDYQTTASIQGALTSGARAAQSLLSGPQ